MLVISHAIYDSGHGYLDGMIIDPNDAELIRTWDLAAVEFFQAAEVPGSYRNKPYGRGVVLLWSKWY